MNNISVTIEQNELVQKGSWIDSFATEIVIRLLFLLSLHFDPLRVARFPLSLPYYIIPVNMVPCVLLHAAEGVPFPV